MTPSRQTRCSFPINLLVEGRSCLVVGGGKVAAHKIRRLLDCKAVVRVVAPELCADLEPLARQGLIRHVDRDFQAADVDAHLLVFAATDREKVNRQVLEACKARSVLCCPVDRNWVEGDFITPATVHKNELTISVSTGGQSCRRSRLIKDSLSRHVDLMESADLLVIGTSHAVLPLHAREPYHLSEIQKARVGQMLMHAWGLHEFMVLNTCNRIEVLGIMARHDGAIHMLERILGFDHVRPGEYYIRQGFEAFEHVALLTSGLLSQTLGENHIVSQFKDSLTEAVEEGWAGPALQEWNFAALHLSKKIRALTAGQLPTLEVEDVCLDYLDRNDVAWARKPVLVLGTGVVGTGLVERLCRRGVAVDWWYHAHKPELRPEWGRRVRLDTLARVPGGLGAYRTVFCATGSPDPILRADQAAAFDPAADVMIVDLSTPRNVDSNLDGATPRLHVIDLDTLKYWFNRELVTGGSWLDQSRQAIGDNREWYEKIVNSFQGGHARQ